MIRLRSWPSVKQEVRDDIRALVRRIPKVVDIRHVIHLYLIPAVFYLCGDDTTYGQFHEPSSGDPCEIWACGMAYDNKGRRWLEGDEELKFIRTTVIHEIAHYCQFRDGKKLTERGIKARTESLYRLLYGEAV